MVSYAAGVQRASVGDFLANPPYPNFDLASCLQRRAAVHRHAVRLRRRHPAGFDCSGFVMYVYAQFGVSMPHSSAGQGAMGTRISEADAQPGDLVIMAGHDGFYAGNGMILHAPYEGASVRVAADLDERLLHRAHRHLNGEHRVTACCEWRAGITRCAVRALP